MCTYSRRWASSVPMSEKPHIGCALVVETMVQNHGFGHDCGNAHDDTGVSLIIGWDYKITLECVERSLFCTFALRVDDKFEVHYDVDNVKHRGLIFAPWSRQGAYYIWVCETCKQLKLIVCEVYQQDVRTRQANGLKKLCICTISTRSKSQ